MVVRGIYMYIYIHMQSQFQASSVRACEQLGSLEWRHELDQFSVNDSVIIPTENRLRL